MHLLSPAYLWLVLYIIPAILILYLLKREYQDMSISSTWLWRKTFFDIEASRPWQKFRYHLLLILQLLAALFFLFGLSRPAFPTDGFTAKHTVLVIDVSGSMWAKEQQKTRIEAAKEQAIDWIHQKSPEQMVTVIAMGKVPNIVVSQGKNKKELVKKIEQLEANISPADFSSTMSLAHAISSKDSSSEVILISDGAFDTGASTHLPHRYVQIGQVRENVAIGSVSSEPKGSLYDLFVRVDHWGRKDKQVTVSVRSQDDRLLRTKSVRMNGKQSEMVHFEQLPKAEYYQIQIHSEHDALSLDNRQYHFIDAREPATIQWLGKENLFLQKVLELHPNLTWEHNNQASSNGLFPFSIVNNDQRILPTNSPLLVIRPHQSQKLLTITGKQSVSGPVEINQNHPIVHKLPLKELSIAEVAKVKVPNWAETILKVNDTPILLAGEYKERKVVIFLFELENSDLVLQPSFPILISQTIDWLYPLHKASGIEANVGEPIDLTVSSHIQNVVISNYGQQWKQAVLGGRIRWQVPERVGFYRITDAQTKENLANLSVAFPKEESDLTPKSVATIENEPTQSMIVSEQEWWWWLALCTGLIISVEWVVVMRGY